MIANKSFLRIILLCLVILQTSLVTAYAQEPDKKDSIVIATSGQLNLTFQQLGYDTKYLNRDRSTRYYRIDLPSNLQISPTGNHFTLFTSHLPEIPDKLSALEVELNGRLVSTFILTATNAISNIVHIDLPEGILNAGTNSLKIALNTSASCEDPGAIVNAQIDQNSTLSFGYQQLPYPTDLSLYPFPFITNQRQILLKIPVTIVLPDHPTSNDLSAAATVAAGLGQMSGGSIDLTAALASDLGPDIKDNNHLILIGKPGDNDLLKDLELPLPIDSTIIEPGQGVLEEILSPWNEFRLILVVSALDDEGMLKASHALNRKAHFLNMRGSIAIVTQLQPSPDNSEVTYIPSMTLASLGYEDEIAYGAKPQDYTYDFTLPQGWQLDEPPIFVLKFTHAEILDPYESVIDINLNGVPVGSTLLDDTNTSEGELNVSLPERLLTSGNNRLSIGVEMNFPAATRDKCKDLLNERAWTVISNESEIFLPYNTVDVPPDLRLFPYPFSQNFDRNQTLFVLPDQPHQAIFNYLIQLAARMGSPTTTEYISTHVAYTSEATQDVWKDHHLILLGRPTEHALLSDFNPYLPHPFVADSDMLAPLVIDSTAFLPDPGRDAGLLQVADSPWNKEYSLLAITGTTDKGLQLAVQTLLEHTAHLEGNLAVIEPTIVPFSNQLESISIYATDTRSPAPADEETNAPDNEFEEKETIDNTTFESKEILLAERWWK